MARRSLKFRDLNDVILETAQLLIGGYSKSGEWSLGQICRHLRLTIECNIKGYPTWMMILGFPLRPILRRFALPKLMAGKSPSGIPTAGMFVPEAGADDEQEVELLRHCVDSFLTSTTSLHSHPGFGAMTKSEFAEFHAAHAAHHLGFLHPGPFVNAAGPRD